MATPKKAVWDKMGAPTKYNEELADKICKLVATHSCGLSTLVKQYGLPDPASIYNWLNAYPDFFDKYMEAKQQQAHVLANAMLEVAESIPVHQDKDGNDRIDAGMLGRAKLQLHALAWSAGKLAPKWYGDKKEEENKSQDINNEVMKRKHELDEKNKKEF